MQVGERLRTISNSRLGPALPLTSKQGATPFALKEEKVQKQLSGVGPWFLNMKVPVRILGKEAVTGQQSVERDDLGQEAKQALGAVFTRDRPAP